MEITYQRTPTESHMVISGQIRQIGYEEEMLKKNSVPVLLSFYTTECDGCLQFWYDITGKKSLRDFAMQEGVTTEHIRTVFEYLSLAYRSLSEYLIGDENVYISPDTVFMERKRTVWQLFLIYCPMEHDGFAHQIRGIVQFYRDTADLRQQEVSDLLQKMLRITEEEGFSLKDILDVLREDLSEPLGSVSQELEQAPESASEPWSSSPQEGWEAALDLLGEPTGYQDPAISEDPAVIPESKKKRSTVSKIRLRIRALLDGWKKKVFRKKEELFPPEDEMADIDFDPVEEDVQETSFLSESDLHCSGKLLYEGGGTAERDFTISHTPFSIGSKEGKNDAVLHSGVVSRYHARIIRENDMYYLQDLNSRNGTYLNGRLLPYHEAALLKPMDMISFADVTYRVV